MKHVKPKKAAPTAAELLAQKKDALERAVFALCDRFERDTGLVIYTIRHPRDDSDMGAMRVLKPEDRLEVGIAAPFMRPARRYS